VPRPLLPSLALLSAFLSPAPALAQRAGGSTGHLEAAPSIAPLRAEIAAGYGAPPAARRAAWERFLRASGSSSWQALWDRDTSSPVRVFGAGVPAPGAVGDPARAEAYARAFIHEHLALLAPGVSPDHLRLAADDLDAGLRTVAFEQLAPVEGAGLVPVLRGQLSVRFKNDRLFVFASETFPAARLPAPAISPSDAEHAAATWIAETHATAALHAAPELYALPLVRPGRVELRAAFRVVLDARSPRARWAVYVDARSGEALAREELLRFDQATVSFDAPLRAPQLGRGAFPARRLDLQIDGAPLSTDDNGAFSWTSTGTPAQVALDARGPLVNVMSQGGGNATVTQSASDGAELLWSLASDEFGDAQLSAFIHASIIKAHARTIAPTMTFLDWQLTVRPNEDDPQGCNAFWDGSALNFFRQNGLCNNSARVADVVYHEFGHAFHQHSIITGAGMLDPSLGEAAGDTMAASYTHDPLLGPGFYLAGNLPLRELDQGARWPDDIREDPHETGLIWGGAMWDLRVYLTQDLGPAQGHATADQLYYQALRRASNIPSTYAEILAADDDDGDLSNGTPHVCAINRAFLAHGLCPVLNEAGLVLEHEPLTVLPPGGGLHPLLVTSKILYPQCSGSPPIDGVTVSYHLLGGGPAVDPLTPQGSSWVGALPAMADGAALRYTITASVGGSQWELPRNPADDEYRTFVGETIPLHCNDFETQIDGWTFGDAKGGSGDFSWGPPHGLSSDPATAFSGQKVIGNRLTGDGAYKGGRAVFADSPVIDLSGEEHVRLQYRRWLNVEDGYYDQANVYVNGVPVWQNASTGESNGTLDHRDGEWRFEDLDLGSFVGRGATTAQVRFELASDATRQLGGWNIDDFCIVAWHPAAPPADGGADGGPHAGAPEPGGCACALAGGAEGGPVPRSALAIAAIAALLARTITAPRSPRSWSRRRRTRSPRSSRSRPRTR
jgi:hypothetical protein